MSEVLLSDLAEEDLIEIWVFVAQDNAQAADRLIDQIHGRCKFLAGSPGAGRQRLDLGLHIRSFVVGKYVIFYRETPNGIEVARVLHGRRDIQSHFHP